MFFFKEKNQIKVKMFSDENNRNIGALFGFNGQIKNELLRRFKENYSIEGDHIKNGGSISPQSMMSLIGGGGAALGASGFASGTLFMATANPATLMTIGSGVGSAVMGTAGIIGQAPFIPIAGALMPVLAPLLAFQALSTIMIMNQFGGIHDRLDHIEKTLSRILQRSEATYIGEIISASKRIEELESNFSICNHFTNDMIIRLALVEDKVNPIFERFKFLYHTQSVDKNTSLDDLKFKQNDAYFSIILSILDLRIDLLRLKLAIQDNPGFMKHKAQSLVAKATYYKEFWQDISTNPKAIEAVAKELDNAVKDMGAWNRNMPSWLGGKRSERKEMENKSSSFERVALHNNADLKNDLVNAVELGDQIIGSADNKKPMSLVYWKDEAGDHSYYTNDFDIISPRQIAA